MKQFILVLGLLIFNQLHTFSQDADSKWALEISTGKNEYRGDRGIGFFTGGVDYSGFSGIGVNKDFIEIGLTKYLNSNFDISGLISSGDYGIYRHQLNYFSGRKSDLTIGLRYKLNNGYILSENAFISPYFSVGAGAATYSGYESSVPMSYLLNFGIGLKLRLSPALSIQYHLSYNFNTDDVADRKTAHDNQPKANNDFVDGNGDNFLKQTFGIVLNFGNFGKSSGKGAYSNAKGSGSIFNMNRNKGRLFTKR